MIVHRFAGRGVQYKHLKSINIAVTSKELVTYSGQIKG